MGNLVYNAIIGLVVGDALGVPYEFKKRGTFKANKMTGYGSHNQPVGTWSDDSSMTLATMDSMISYECIDLEDIMRNFRRWLYEDEFTATGKNFDTGRTVHKAILNHLSGVPALECGGKDNMDNGNGALMRILPIALSGKTNTPRNIVNVANLTHAHEISDYCCLIYSEMVANLICGADKETALAYAMAIYQNEIEEISSLNEMCYRLLNIQNLRQEEIRSTGYVVDTLEAALWSFITTNSYRECVLKAINLGGDTDTIAAVAGGLAGLYYGTDTPNGIPSKWIEQIARKEWIKELCDEFYGKF